MSLLVQWDAGSGPDNSGEGDFPLSICKFRISRSPRWARPLFTGLLHTFSGFGRLLGEGNGGGIPEVALTRLMTPKPKGGRRIYRGFAQSADPLNLIFFCFSHFLSMFSFKSLEMRDKKAEINNKRKNNCPYHISYSAFKLC